MNLHLLPPHLLKRIELRLLGVLQALAQDGAPPPLADCLGQFVVARSAKRLRPQLCIWMYQQLCSESTDLNGITEIACAWELFHAFLLAHDDLIDRAEQRRGQQSLHRALQRHTSDSEETAAALALVAGDLLNSAALGLLHQLEVAPGIHRQLLGLFSEIAVETGLGQAMDIWQSHRPPGEVNSADVLRDYYRKTAAYTFKGPLLSAAVLAGTAGEDLEAIQRFSQAVGVAYQLHNDLHDLLEPVAVGGDIMQGKRTLALLHVRRTMGQIDREQLDDALMALPEANGQSLTIAAEVRRQLLEAGAEPFIRQMIDKQFAAALQLPPGTTPRLSEILASLRSRLQESCFQMAIPAV